MAAIATKFFSCFRWFGKCRVKSLSVKRPHNVLHLKTLCKACSVFSSNSVLKNSSHDRETRSNQRESRACKNRVLLGLPVAVLVFIYLSTSLAFCGKEDSTVSTPTNLIFSRTRKAEKRKARTEKARVERCKRRLFSDEDSDNITLPVLAEPHMLRKNTKLPHRLAEDIVSGNKQVAYYSLKAILQEILINLPELASYFF